MESKHKRRLDIKHKNKPTYVPTLRQKHLSSVGLLLYIEMGRNRRSPAEKGLKTLFCRQKKAEGLFSRRKGFFKAFPAGLSSV